MTANINLQIYTNPKFLNKGKASLHEKNTDFTLTSNIYNRKYNILKVIYHPLYGMNNYIFIWGDRLSCDPLRGSHDSQSPHIWGDWLSCDSLRGSHDSQSPHIRGKHIYEVIGYHVTLLEGHMIANHPI